MLEVNNPQSDNIDIEKLLKPVDVARILNVSRSFAYLLMQSGDIPVVRLGHCVRVRPCDIRNYILKSTINADDSYQSNTFHQSNISNATINL